MNNPMIKSIALTLTTTSGQKSQFDTRPTVTVVFGHSEAIFSFIIVDIWGLKIPIFNDSIILTLGIRKPCIDLPIPLTPIIDMHSSGPQPLNGSHIEMRTFSCEQVLYMQ